MARSGGMAARRMLALPWWLFLLLAPVAHFVIAQGVPAILAGRRDAVLVSGVVQVFAPLTALLLVLLALVVGLTQRRTRLLFDQQTNLESIRTLRWSDFERLVGEAYRRRGYSVLESGGGGADGGVDLVVSKNGRYLVQCKHWKALRVGVKEVRELFGIVTAERAAGGILVTSGRFTEDAKDFTNGKPIELVDGEQLLALVRDIQSGSSPVSAGDVSGRDQREAPSGQQCPRCGRDMVLRTARHGAFAGEQFWGCANFPNCRATVAVRT